MPEAQVVERDHPHKDDGERKDLRGFVKNWTFYIRISNACSNYLLQY